MKPTPMELAAQWAALKDEALCAYEYGISLSQFCLRDKTNEVIRRRAYIAARADILQQEQDERERL